MMKLYARAGWGSVIAEAQKKGATCAFVDAEHALDPDYAEKLGVNVDDLIVSCGAAWRAAWGAQGPPRRPPH